jgi:hypothetical protein
MIRKIGFLSVVAAVAVAANASPAGATVTIGSNLGREPDVSSQYDPRPTFANLSLAPDRQAPGGLASPVNGTVVRWRIRVAGITEVTNFRIIRPLVGGLYTGAGTSPQVTPPSNATTPYDVQLPIQVGDYIGLDCCDPDFAAFFVSDHSGASVRSEWYPQALADGAPGRAPDQTGNYEITLNADIEPTSTFTLGAITRNKKKGTATITINDIPNPGELVGSGNGAKVASTGQAGISKSVGTGAAQLLIKAKGKKKKKLNQKGKVKLNVAVTYTPTGGDPRTQSLKVKLTKKL